MMAVVLPASPPACVWCCLGHTYRTSDHHVLYTWRSTGADKKHISRLLRLLPLLLLACWLFIVHGWSDGWGETQYANAPALYGAASAGAICPAAAYQSIVVISGHQLPLLAAHMYRARAIHDCSALRGWNHIFPSAADLLLLLPIHLLQRYCRTIIDS